MSKNRVELMQRALTEALEPTFLEIRDDSAAHVGHPGAAAGGGHYTVTISAPALQGQSRINAHRMIYSALGDMMQHEIHALNIVIKG